MTDSHHGLYHYNANNNVQDSVSNGRHISNPPHGLNPTVLIIFHFDGSSTPKGFVAFSSSYLGFVIIVYLLTLLISI